MRSVDDYVTCPFFNEHKIRKSKFYKHVIKCEKGRNVDYCPFNRNHIVEKGKLNDHLSNHCQDMEISLPELKAFNQEEDGRGPPTGYIQSAPSNYDDSMIVSDEWSKDLNTNPPYIHGQKQTFKVVSNSNKELSVATGFSSGLRPGFGRGIIHGSANYVTSINNKSQRLGANFGRPTLQVTSTANKGEIIPPDVKNLYPPGYEPRGPREPRGDV